MKEFVFTYYRYGYFLSNLKNTAEFGTEKQVRLVIEPIEYEFKLNDEIIRNAECEGYFIDVTSNGAVKFYDYKNNLIAESDETQSEYTDFDFNWSKESLKVRFGHREMIDTYPNCDGEHDRWVTRCVAQYAVTLNTTNNSVVTEILNLDAED